MNQAQQINAEIDRAYTFLSDAPCISPSGLAHQVYEKFRTGDEDPCIEYASLEHIKQMARDRLRRRKDADGDLNETHGAQGDFGFGTSFNGKLQDRYPIPRAAGEEPVYKLRSELTPEERTWNANQLRKSARSRLEHADALEAEGMVKAAAA